jgi:hypothetical protein
MDLGLYKSFTITEKIRLTFRTEAFNLTNTQHFTGISSLGLVRDPWTNQTPGGAAPAPPSTFGKFTGIQGTPRVLQFALRLDF